MNKPIQNTDLFEVDKNDIIDFFKNDLYEMGYIDLDILKNQLILPFEVSNMIDKYIHQKLRTNTIDDILNYNEEEGI